MISFLIWLLGCILVAWLDSKVGPEYGEVFILWIMWTGVFLCGKFVVGHLVWQW